MKGKPTKPKKPSLKARLADLERWRATIESRIESAEYYQKQWLTKQGGK